MPTPELPWVDVATGSLGQGLPCAVGVALSAKRLEQLAYRTWVLCGDSEVENRNGFHGKPLEDPKPASTAITSSGRCGRSSPPARRRDRDEA